MCRQRNIRLLGVPFCSLGKETGGWGGLFPEIRPARPSEIPPAQSRETRQNGERFGVQIKFEIHVM